MRNITYYNAGSDNDEPDAGSELAKTKVLKDVAIVIPAKKKTDNTMGLLLLAGIALLMFSGNKK